MRVTWVNGWGLEGDYVLDVVESMYPDYEHSVVYSDSDWERELDRLPEIDVLIGFSLGAHLLAGRPEIVDRCKRAILLAPFEDFKADSDKGGKVRRGQLVYLSRWLDRDPNAAILDFRERAGLNGAIVRKSSISVVELKWGIERLLDGSVDGEFIRRMECYVGSEDTLLDSARLKELYPNINVVEGAGHDLAELLEKAGIEL